MSSLIEWHYECDMCHAKETMLWNTMPDGWSFGEINICGGFTGPKIHLCKTCWPSSTPDVDEKKKKTLCDLIKGYL